MIRALRTGNYSVVIGWLTDELTEQEHERLALAAEEGHAMGFYHAPGEKYKPARETIKWAKKIHSNLYH